MERLRTDIFKIHEWERKMSEDIRELRETFKEFRGDIKDLTNVVAKLNENMAVMNATQAIVANDVKKNSARIELIERSRAEEKGKLIGAGAAVTAGSGLISWIVSLLHK